MQKKIDQPQAIKPEEEGPIAESFSFEEKKRHWQGCSKASRGVMGGSPTDCGPHLKFELLNFAILNLHQHRRNYSGSVKVSGLCS